jgi:hypothetical protein
VLFGDVEVNLYMFLTMTLVEVSGQLHTPFIFSPRQRICSISWIGGWMGHGVMLYLVVLKKFWCPYNESNPGHLLYSQSHYQRPELSLYLAHYIYTKFKN